MGRHMHPEITMHTHPLGEYMEHIYRDEWQGIAELMLSSADKLARAGAGVSKIAAELGRHAGSVKRMARAMGILLKK